MTDETDGKRQVLGNVEITGILTDKRQLRMSGLIYSDDTAHDLNERLDMMQSVIDRQVIRFDLISKEAELAAVQASEAGLDELYEGLRAKLEAKGKLPTVEKEKMAQYEGGKRFHLKKQESLAAAIAAAHRKLNGAAPAQ